MKAPFTISFLVLDIGNLKRDLRHHDLRVSLLANEGDPESFWRTMMYCMMYEMLCSLDVVGSCKKLIARKRLGPPNMVIDAVLKLTVMQGLTFVGEDDFAN